MQLNTARQAWHDCTYGSWGAQSAFAAQLTQLGTRIQTTTGQRHAARAVHQALAGAIQAAIASLSRPLRAFGNYLYAPHVEAWEQQAAELAVFLLVQQRGKRMTATKREKLEVLVKGVLLRYRYMHQGGQSANVDPLAAPEAFRGWLQAHYQLSLSAVRWEREWGGYVRLAFDCCEDLDKQALAPIATRIHAMKKK
ncbi:hypothetical protein [Pseudomonas cremoricolorata]|uniref:Prophage PssSM-02 n=1 Tax=Pseudomonas cremoricolorata TaxID=157783 RepID=A0A089YGB5_9PSED|nr:hypothetical protein [Pseudomonas cremoricolorata]AIR90753.1 prophage PssSM-02 [Pseudomonas cremoricolorata]